MVAPAAAQLARATFPLDVRALYRPRSTPRMSSALKATMTVLADTLRSLLPIAHDLDHPPQPGASLLSHWSQVGALHQA